MSISFSKEVQIWHNVLEVQYLFVLNLMSCVPALCPVASDWDISVGRWLGYHRAADRQPQQVPQLHPEEPGGGPCQGRTGEGSSVSSLSCFDVFWNPSIVSFPPSQRFWKLSLESLSWSILCRSLLVVQYRAHLMEYLFWFTEHNNVVDHVYISPRFCSCLWRCCICSM